MFTGSKPKTDICLQLLSESEKHSDDLEYLDEESACRKCQLTQHASDLQPDSQNASDCHQNYSICALKHFGYVDKKNNINKTSLIKLMNESNTGYVFKSDNERERFLDIVRGLTKIDNFAKQYCHESNERQRQVPLYPNIYCPLGQRSGVSVRTFCRSCRKFCSVATKGTAFCTILKTKERDYCFGVY